MNKTIFITGANNGLGKDAARQLALEPTTEKIYLACRNLDKAIAAKRDLEELTGREIFEIILLDTTDLNSVRHAVKELPEAVDALIMNAGGMGGKTAYTMTEYGVNEMFAVNVLGHVVLVDELLKSDKLKKVALYASSEAARGVDKMSIAQPKLKNYSVEEFSRIFDGSYFDKWDPMQAYAYTKYIATLWMSAMSRKHNNIRFVSVSPGSTSGTGAVDNAPLAMKIMFKYIFMPIVLPLRGLVHKLEHGAKRYVDAISDESYETGIFYASQETKLTGPMVDQSVIFPDLANNQFQDNADKAIRKVLAAA